MELVHEKQTDPGRESTCDVMLNVLARSASIEATPRQILAENDQLEWIPAGTFVYVPFLPNAQYSETIDACRQLLAEGLVPVPHFPARAIESYDQASRWLDSLATLDVRHLMLIAGDRREPDGPFRDTLDLLETGILQDYPAFSLGVAGHPDGHPFADGNELIRALRIKREYAAATGTSMWVTTQFAFEADVFTDWLEATHHEIAPLPVYFGLAGPTKLRTLIAYAAQCGVGFSARAMRRRPDTARLLRAWTPDGLVRSLAGYLVEHPEALLRGIHIFPFGGLKRSARWLYEQQGDDAPALAASQSSG